MKTPVLPHMVLVAFAATVASIQAQSLELRETMPMAAQSTPVSDAIDGRRFEPALPIFDELPTTERVPSVIEEETSLVSQDLSLAARSIDRRSMDSVIDLDVLRKPSPFRKVMVGLKRKPYELSTDSLETGLAEISAAYRDSGEAADTLDCGELALSIQQQVTLDTSKVLEIVEREIGTHPKCACETVKAAIKTSEADVDGVVAIVETAIHAAPDQMRIISQCAIATMPESISAVQALLSRLDPNAGDTGYSSKSAKGSKDAKVAIAMEPALPNPLDVPPEGPPIMPPPIVPPFVTDVDPCGKIVYRLAPDFR
ncbi:MAG: hypothetical protein H7A48_12930 [Akkermansiaceae bacterium]|nr:hypothetical protein [Akkermansiaceae bacterium]